MRDFSVSEKVRPTTADERRSRNSIGAIIESKLFTAAPEGYGPAAAGAHAEELNEFTITEPAAWS
jgi:hypothetical protein